MKEYLVYIKCYDFREMQYYSKIFVNKYVHRVIMVKNYGFNITLGYDDGNKVNIIFELSSHYEREIIGKRNVRFISAQVSKVLNFDIIDNVIALPIDPITYLPNEK